MSIRHGGHIGEQCPRQAQEQLCVGIGEEGKQGAKFRMMVPGQVWGSWLHRVVTRKETKAQGCQLEIVSRNRTAWESRGQRAEKGWRQHWEEDILGPRPWGNSTVGNVHLIFSKDWVEIKFYEYHTS